MFYEKSSGVNPYVLLPYVLLPGTALASSRVVSMVSQVFQKFTRMIGLDSIRAVIDRGLPGLRVICFAQSIHVNLGPRLLGHSNQGLFEVTAVQNNRFSIVDAL
jgi:hypothetical protein